LKGLKDNITKLINMKEQDTASLQNVYFYENEMKG
jgi:hypothetical protein